MTNPLEFPPTLNFPKVQIPQYLIPFGMKIVRETLEHPWPIDFDESLVNRINFEDPTFLGEHLNRCIIYLDHNVPSFKEIEQDQKKHIGKEYSEYILALLRAFIELVSIAKK